MIQAFKKLVIFCCILLIIGYIGNLLLDNPFMHGVIRNAINDGTIVGPRYLAASQEITVPGGLGDTTQPHLPQPEFAFGAVVSVSASVVPPAGSRAGSST